MPSKSKLLRDDYLNGYEIVVADGLVNDARPDGYHVVIYQPRSGCDKSPWVRVTGFPFRYHAGELKSVATCATQEYAACKHHSGCKHTRAEVHTGIHSTGSGRYDPTLMAAYDRAEESLRAMDMLDEHWYQM
jgi:hypothetical protein